jgi:release factor glutamine methyltransferase
MRHMIPCHMISPRSGATWIAQASREIDRFDAELLLAHCWRRTRTRLLTSEEPVPEDVAACFQQAIRQRTGGVPVAYLLGRREFWSLDFEVSPAVLVPRPETELLVQRALDVVDTAHARVADLGTGSGAIAIALAHERPQWSVTGTDVSPQALAIARRNGSALVNGRVEWLQGDWFAPLAGRRFDALMSNPPYIEGDDPVLSGDGLRHEPRAALTPEGDGMAALTTLINGAPDHLGCGGWLLLEHGAGQAEGIRTRLVARGFTSVTSHRDLAGHERVTEGKLAA